MFGIVWAWVLAHIPNMISTASNVKLIAETIDSVKKLAPEKLEMKDTTQSYLTETLSIVKDQDKGIEERQMELEARGVLTESMVKLTVIEATYNVARYAIFASFTMFALHLLTRIIAMPKRKAQTLPSA